MARRSEWQTTCYGLEQLGKVEFMTATAIGFVVAVMLLISLTSPVPEDIPEELTDERNARPR
jgi:hypothetical protein